MFASSLPLSPLRGVPATKTCDGHRPRGKSKGVESGLKGGCNRCGRRTPSVSFAGVEPSDPNPEETRRQLERVPASEGFARNERLSQFLRFVVERSLEGRESELKESVLVWRSSGGSRVTTQSSMGSCEQRRSDCGLGSRSTTRTMAAGIRWW
jgi:hypothetical protein